jgi:hypothetical protein
MRASMAAGVLLAVALGGCSSKGSAGPAPGNDGGSVDAAASFASSACGTCVSQACAAAVTACNSDPGCSTYMSCEGACGVGADGNVDPTCAAQCPAPSSSEGASAEMQLNDCRTAGPGAACSACGTDAASSNPILGQKCTATTDTTACATCEDDSCCHTEASCLADADCEALHKCIVDCDNGVMDDAGSTGAPPDGGTCDYTCAQLHPKGLVDWAPRMTCIDLYCYTPCSGVAPDPCTACAITSCAAEFADLKGTVAGYLLNACTDGCPMASSSCNNACIAEYPSVMAASNAFGACTQKNCPLCD